MREAMYYTSPEARVIRFEAVSVILASDSNTLPDTPELLSLLFEEEKTTKLRDFY